MGASITIDKHTTDLRGWFQIENQLTDLQFQAQINNHLSLWKIASNQITPINLQSTLIFEEDAAYVVTLVIKSDYSKQHNIDYSTKQTLLSLIRNIEKDSYEVSLRQGITGDFNYFIYSYLGNQSASSVRILAVNYALRIESLMSCETKLRILTGGGVYKNKKLQRGSLLTLDNRIPEENQSISQFKNIHLLSQIVDMRKKPKLKIFMYEPKQKISSIHQQGSLSDKKAQLIPSLKISKNNKPPALKLDLKPLEQVTYEQIEEEQNNGKLKFDIRATARHQLQMQKFRTDCTKIIDGLYVSGQKVASDQKILKQFEITSIVNCAGDYCENFFEKDPRYSYLTFFLKDSQHQNIECLFYTVIDFINNAIRNKQNVLVHCIQGISRSVTFVIAYLIFMNGFDYKKAENFVKEKRRIACPNNGFMVELIQFYKRLYENYDSLPIPRVFLVSSHCSETPMIITARLLKYSLFEKKKFVGMDSRGIYIVQCKDIIYLWVGSQCQEEKQLKHYWAYSQSYIKRLQQHEKAPMKIKAISQQNQSKDFLQIWKVDSISEDYTNEQYNKLFVEIKDSKLKPGHLRKYYENDDQVIQQNKERLFIFPDHQNGLGVFDLEDLTGFSLLVHAEEEYVTIHRWKSNSWLSDESIEDSFLNKVIESHYGGYDAEEIEIKEEDSENLSESFLNCFS